MRIPKKHVLVVCHDAGVAEVLSTYVKNQTARCRFSCVVSGPAKRIFTRKHLSHLIVPKTYGIKLLDKKGKISKVLAGTSWVSGLGHEFIQKAKEKVVKSVVYLDHWINYRERFGYPKENWRNNLPDEIWVGDRQALKRAKQYFRHCVVKLIPNPYFQDVKAMYRIVRGKVKIKGNDILFMSEPTKLAHKTFYEAGYVFDETNVLKKVLDYLSEKNVKNTIVICYHPAEKKDKYRSLLTHYKGKLRFRKQKNNLLKDLVRAKLVIGRRSMALALAALCSKKTVSFIPDRKVAFPLPFKKIMRIRDIKKLERMV